MGFMGDHMAKITDMGITGVAMGDGNIWGVKVIRSELVVKDGGIPGRIRTEDDMGKDQHVLIHGTVRGDVG